MPRDLTVLPVAGRRRLAAAEPDLERSLKAAADDVQQY